jgi:hypothetical protein
MRKHWFNCKVQSQALDQEGKEIKATEFYMVDAETYTEAEARIIGVMQQEIRGVFDVVNITKSNYAEVFFYDDAEKWFRVKVSLIFYDDETEKEKNQNQYFLIRANDVQEAYTKTEQVMSGTVSSYVIPSINYTKIIDVYLSPQSQESEKPKEEAPSNLTPMTEFEEE